MSAALEIPQLHALVDAVAADEALWRRHVTHDPERRVFHKLVDTAQTTVWLICWMPGQDTGLHDHDGSSGAVRVVEGAVREERLGPGGIPASRLLVAGRGFDFGPEAVHGVRHAGEAPAVTLHAYSPRLRGMGTYVVDPDGVVRRRRLAEDEELRAAAA